MKSVIYQPGRKAGMFVSFALAMGILLAAPKTTAQIITLADGNSVADIDTGSQTGMFWWSVDGIGHLYQQWFWYRIGNVAEVSVDTISAPVNFQPDARRLTTTYANATLSIRLDYVLSGGLPGSGVADIAESITIDNLTASSLTLSFFQYSDFDLLGTAGGDTVRLGTNLSGKFNEARQTEGPVVFVESVNSPGADHGEVNFFPVTLNKLNDGVATTLTGAAGPLGPGDVTWALQWDFVIPGGGSKLISKDKALTVPEPSAVVLGLIGFGALAVARVYRSRSR